MLAPLNEHIAEVLKDGTVMVNDRFPAYSFRLYNRYIYQWNPKGEYSGYVCTIMQAEKWGFREPQYCRNCTHDAMWHKPDCGNACKCKEFVA